MFCLFAILLLLGLVLAPHSAPPFPTSTNKHLTIKVDGYKLPDLPREEQKKMVKAGLDACFAQLLGIRKKKKKLHVDHVFMRWKFMKG